MAPDPAPPHDCRDTDDAVTVLVEPHTVTRTGLTHMLAEAVPGGRVVAVAAPEGLTGALAARHCLTFVLPAGGLSGTLHHLDALLQRPCTRLVLIAGHLARERLHIVARLPVDAVIREEDLSVANLASVLGASGQGMVSVSRDTMRELLALAADPVGAAGRSRAPLSGRELHALRLMTAGLSNREIAKDMRITEHGAKRHVANILVKLGCQNRTMAAIVGLRLGLVDLEPAGGSA